MAVEIGQVSAWRTFAGMVELLRSNDPVLLSFVSALLADADVEAVLADLHTSILEGSIGALPRRLMVAPDQAARAKRVLREAGFDVPA